MRGHDTSTKTVDEDDGVLLFLERGTVGECGVDVSPSRTSAAVPAFGNAAAAPANARAAAPSATDASGVMTKLFIARPSFGGQCARLLT